MKSALVLILVAFLDLSIICNRGADCKPVNRFQKSLEVTENLNNDDKMEFDHSYLNANKLKNKINFLDCFRLRISIFDYTLLQTINDSILDINKLMKTTNCSNIFSNISNGFAPEIISEYLKKCKETDLVLKQSVMEIIQQSKSKSVNPFSTPKSNISDKISDEKEYSRKHIDVTTPKPIQLTTVLPTTISTTINDVPKIKYEYNTDQEKHLKPNQAPEKTQNITVIFQNSETDNSVETVTDIVRNENNIIKSVTQEQHVDYVVDDNSENAYYDYDITTDSNTVNYLEELDGYNDTKTMKSDEVYEDRHVDSYPKHIENLSIPVNPKYDEKPDLSNQSTKWENDPVEMSSLNDSVNCGMNNCPETSLCGKMYFLFRNENIPGKFVQDHDGNIEFGIQGNYLCNVLFKGDKKVSLTLKNFCKIFNEEK